MPKFNCETITEQKTARLLRSSDLILYRRRSSHRRF